MQDHLRAPHEPVFVEKAGQLDTVILSAEQYQVLKANHDKASRVARKDAFEAEYGDWIAFQNARFETRGIPGTCARGERPMAQYDVFTNPSGSAAQDIPYVVVVPVQNDLLDALATRLTGRRQSGWPVKRHSSWPVGRG